MTGEAAGGLLRRPQTLGAADGADEDPTTAEVVRVVDERPADELGMGIHGGLEETSVILHLRPDLVAMDRAVRNVPEWMTANEQVRFGGSVPFGWLSSDFGPSGLIGDPLGATAEHGKAVFEAAVTRLGRALAEPR